MTIQNGNNVTLDGTGLFKLDATSFLYELDFAQTPFFTMLMSKNPRKVGNRKDYQFNIVPQLKRTYALTAVDSATKFTVDDATGLQAGITLEVLPGGSAVAGVSTKSQRLITDVTGNVVTIDSTFGGTLIIGNEVYRSGNATGQGSNSPNSILPEPVAGTNNAQEFKKSMKIVTDISEGRELTYYDFVSLAKRHNSVDFKLDIENTLWFGRKSSNLNDSDGNRIYTTRGFYTALTGGNMQVINEKGVTYKSLIDLNFDGSNFDFATFHKWAAESMIYGSTEKYLFVDSWLDRQIRDIHRDTLRTTADDKMLGLEVTKIKAGKGTINMIMNPQFDTGSTFNGGILVDPANVKLDTYRTPTLQGKIQGTDEDAEKSQFVGTFGIEYAAPETHGLITHELS